MQVFGRILQVIGWLWFAAGIAGPLVGVGRFSLIPGLVLIFIARAVRAQAARREMPELPAPVSDESPPERVLNTERQRSMPVPAPPPLSGPRSPTEPAGDEPVAQEPSELLERIGMTISQRVEEQEAPPVEPSAEHEPEVMARMSSAEMIAQARKRWDRKPRQLS